MLIARSPNGDGREAGNLAFRNGFAVGCQGVATVGVVIYGKRDFFRVVGVDEDHAARGRRVSGRCAIATRVLLANDLREVFLDETQPEDDVTGQDGLGYGSSGNAERC